MTQAVCYLEDIYSTFRKSGHYIGEIPAHTFLSSVSPSPSPRSFGCSAVSTPLLPVPKHKYENLRTSYFSVVQNETTANFALRCITQSPEFVYVLYLILQIQTSLNSEQAKQTGSR
jgi:hypothetical protein